MTQPAKRNQKVKISKLFKQGFWVLLILIIVVSFIDTIWLNTQQLVAKSFTLGALFNWITQIIFIYSVFYFTGYQARQHIVNHLYLGEVLKWLATLIGFILIFITIKPLSILALFIGFIVMQVSYSWILWKT